MSTPALLTYASDFDAFAAGVAVLGGQAATARLLKVSQPTIHRLIKAGKPIWAEAVDAFEEATGISRSQLRRDLFAGNDGTPARNPVSAAEHAC